MLLFCSSLIWCGYDLKWPWSHADKNVGDENEKSAAQFEALEKGDPSPEKEMIKARAPLSKIA